MQFAIVLNYALMKYFFKVHYNDTKHKYQFFVILTNVTTSNVHYNYLSTSTDIQTYVLHEKYISKLCLMTF